jgi:hypothetical protein
MTRQEKILWLKKAINEEDYLNDAIFKLSQELIIIFFKLFL